jgi:hypothetical protein
MTMLTLHFGHLLKKLVSRNAPLISKLRGAPSFQKSRTRVHQFITSQLYEETLRISAASLVAQRSANPIASQKENEFVARSEIDRKNPL